MFENTNTFDFCVGRITKLTSVPYKLHYRNAAGCRLNQQGKEASDGKRDMCKETYIQNRSSTVGALGGKLLVVVFLTVSFAFTFKECLCCQLLIAAHTCEVLRMPSSAKRSYDLRNTRQTQAITTQ